MVRLLPTLYVRDSYLVVAIMGVAVSVYFVLVAMQDGVLSLEEIEAEFNVFAESAITDYGHVIHEEL